MISIDDLTKFFRIYIANYRIDHDLSLINDASSLWSMEIGVQPSLLSQLPLLRKAFKGKVLSVNEVSGGINVREPIMNMNEFPIVDKIFAGLTPFMDGLAGSKTQLQLIIAPMDVEYNEEFSRAQKWQWLTSSREISELFLVGDIKEGALEFEALYHSCHQSDMNRDISEDCLSIVTQWEQLYNEAALAAGQAIGAAALAQVTNPENNKPTVNPYHFACESPEEAERLFALCENVGIVADGYISVDGNLLTSRLSPILLADMVFSLRCSTVFNLFGADPL